jgi:hypothetical protein
MFFLGTELIGALGRADELATSGASGVPLASGAQSCCNLYLPDLLKHTLEIRLRREAHGSISVHATSSCANGANALFFAGDIGQRIFQHPFSWRAVGIEVRGRPSSLSPSRSPIKWRA